MARRKGVSRYLIWLDEVEADRAVVGGKGASLSRLAALGAPVPRACALPTDAWRVFMRSLRRPKDTVPLDEETLAHIRGLITTSPLPPPLARAITMAFQEFETLPGAHVSLAVRSSAIVEDSGQHSFAGIHDTILGVRSHTGLDAAVRQCWASLWSDRAVEYRAAAGVSVDESDVAIVIQQMVRSDVSFVLFTTDPVTGNRDHAVIAASWGLGEAVVSGLVTPDHVVVDTTGRVVRYAVGAKEYMMLEDPPPGEGTRQLAVPRAMQGARTLTDEQAASIAEMGRDIAARLGYEADIEGGIANGEIYLFQARPITTLVDESAHGSALRAMAQPVKADGRTAMSSERTVS
jgi:rifampicin phosphotransferase